MAILEEHAKEQEATMGGAEADDIELRPGLAFFPLDDALVVFSQASQSLIGLNATAAFLVRDLQDGVPASELADALVSKRGVAAEEAGRWVTTTLAALDSQDLLANGRPPAPPPGKSLAVEESLARRRSKMPPFEPFEPLVEGRYRLLGTYALIRYARRLQMRVVDAVIGHLKSDEPAAPTLVVDISGAPWGDRQLRSNIYCDGKPEAQAAQLSGLGPLVKAALWTRAVNAHDFLLNLHAGVVGKGDSCILLPAEAGSGKSSLTTALTHAGFRYFSDEVALVERGTFQVSPVPLAVCVKSTGWDVMSRYYPEILTLPTHRRDDGKVVRYVPPRAAAVQKSPALVSHIFFPLYAKGQPTRLESLARSDALARLMEQCLALRQRLDHDNVEELVRWIAGIDCYALTFSSLDEAVTLIEKTIAGSNRAKSVSN